MGNKVSFLEAEKKTWILHTLSYDEHMRIVGKQMLTSCFTCGEKVWLGKTKTSYKEFEFERWFLTNGAHFLEFSAANLSIYSAIVNINNLKRSPYLKVPRSEMLVNEEMRIRMHQVTGLSNYSLCLRNSEHVANYVANGRWYSSQMERAGQIMNTFQNYLTAESQLRLVNTPPSDIRTWIFGERRRPVYDFLEPYYRATGFDYYLDAEEDTYNVLIIGPTGAGKSHLINVLFNSHICESRISHIGVTPEVYFIRGQGQITSCHPDSKTLTDVIVRQRTVVVADTIGLCDTRFTDEQIFNLIRGRVSRNIKTLHAVIIVLPTDRIIQVIQENVKKVLKWLNYDKYRGRFLFVFTKSENTDDALQKELRKQAIQTLGLKHTQRISIATNEGFDEIAYVGFPRADVLNDVGTQAVKASYERLKPLLTLEPAESSINLDHSTSCTIL